MNDSNHPPGHSPDDEGKEENQPSESPKVPAHSDRAADGAKADGAKPDSKKPASRSDDDEESLDESEKELGGRMTFLEHLDELRKRIMRSLIAVVITFGVAWAFREEIYRFLAQPIYAVVDRLIVTAPTEPFTIYLKVCFTASIFLAVPFILLQVWLFIAPGLYRREKKFALPFLFSSTVLFVLGGMFAYYVVLPPALNFLLMEFGREFQALINVMEYFDFILLIILGMGIIFQLPVLVAFLSMFGLVTPGFLWKNFRYAFLIITIIAAVVSPTTDPFNLFLWTGPMVILYLISIVVSWIFKRRRVRTEREDRARWS